MKKKKKQSRTRKIIRHLIRWNSFSLKLSLVTTQIAIVAVILIVLALNRRFNESLDKASCISNAQIVKNIKESIDVYLGEMGMLTRKVKELIADSEESKVLNRDLIMRNDINTIAVFDKKGKLVMKSNQKFLKVGIDVKSEEWFSKVTPGSEITNYTKPHVQRLYDNEYPWIISLSKGIEWESKDQKNWGIVLVDLNFNNIKELCTTDIGENGLIYILDENNEIIYHPNQQMLYSGINDDTIAYAKKIQEGTEIKAINGNNYVISVSQLRSNGWRIVGVYQLNGILNYDSRIGEFVILIITIMTIAIMIVANVMSYFIARPMKKLMKLMGRVENGMFDVYAEIKGYNEIAELARSFNTMIYKIQRLMQTVVEEQKQLRKSEMKTLHAQINSHFLYNTLDSIIWMSESGDNENAVKMLSALAQFFRSSLSQGKDIITVEEELTHVESYLIIQKMRFDNQFDYQIKIEESIRYNTTLKMILQPIVENSIIHGVTKLPFEGKIDIEVRKQDNKLLFLVKDNGFGMEPQKIETILQTETKNKSGIGIKNVNHRIKLMYGEDYGLEYESEPDEGTAVKIWIPLEKEEA